MISEYDEPVMEYRKISGVKYIVKMVDDQRLEDEVKKLNTLVLHFGAFVILISKRSITNFMRANNGFYTNDVYYRDTDGLYIENKHWH